jgi:hypothetical protein
MSDIVEIFRFCHRIQQIFLTWVTDFIGHLGNLTSDFSAGVVEDRPTFPTRGSNTYDFADVVVGYRRKSAMLKIYSVLEKNHII